MSRTFKALSNSGIVSYKGATQSISTSITSIIIVTTAENDFQPYTVSHCLGFCGKSDGFPAQKEMALLLKKNEREQVFFQCRKSLSLLEMPGGEMTEKLTE